MRKQSERQIIKQLNKVHEETIARLEASLKECSAGTNTHTKIIEAIAKEKRTHIEFMAKFGVIPSNIGMAAKPKFAYRVIVEQQTKHDRPEDESIRKQLFEQFPDTKERG